MTKINYVGSTEQGSSVEQASCGLRLIKTNADDVLNALISQGYECRNLLNFMLRKDEKLIVEKTIDNYVFHSYRAGKDIEVGISITLTIDMYGIGDAVTVLRYKGFEILSEFKMNAGWVSSYAARIKRIQEVVEEGMKEVESINFDNIFLSEVLTDFDRDYAITLANLLK